ncbi:type III pantothenate kinase [Chloroflexota bacterium]
MLLAVDIGNTNIVIGIFQQDKLEATWHFATNVHKMADEYASILLNLMPLDNLDFAHIDKAIISSVVPPLVTTFEELCKHYLKVTPMLVGTGIKTGVRIRADNPREVGADRVVNAAAAHRRYGGPLIIIDFGTATTFDAVSRDGDLLGSAIAPGITIAAEALYERTAKLPRVELTAPHQSIGKNTVTAMQSGLIFGYVGLIEGIVARMRTELGGKVQVIATGGLASIIARETDIIDTVDHNLTLEGLRLIYELNNKD